MVSYWFEDATVDPGNDAGNFVSGAPYRGVLHTTEGCTYAAAKAAFQQNNSWPHFTIDNSASGIKIYQHVGVDKPSRSLKNLGGGVETNRRGAVQIEIVGFSCCP